MRALRHSLALSTIGLFACVGDSAWETPHDWSAWFREGAHGAAGATARPDDATANAIDWSTPFVSVRADDFQIAVDGTTFLGQTAGASLHSDPGTETYTTLERIWMENGVEMRLFIYFHSDGKDFWASEIRIYDRQANGDWLTLTGEWFRSPLGQSFAGDLDLSFGGKGRLTMRGVELQAFRTPRACLGQNAGYAMEVLYPTIELTTAPGSGFGAAVRLRDQQCEPVLDTSSFIFVWSIDDPAIIEITSGSETSRVDLRGSSAGETTLRVQAERRSDGAVVAEATMDVIVTSASGH